MFNGKNMTMQEWAIKSTEIALESEPWFELKQVCGKCGEPLMVTLSELCFYFAGRTYKDLLRATCGGNTDHPINLKVDLEEVNIDGAG
jgi:hypothetical protein